jgi:hypothetical protein
MWFRTSAKTFSKLSRASKIQKMEQINFFKYGHFSRRHVSHKYLFDRRKHHFWGEMETLFMQ